MLDNTCLKKRKEQKIIELRQSTKIPLEITGFLLPNAVRVMAVKKQTELSGLK